MRRRRDVVLCLSRWAGLSRPEEDQSVSIMIVEPDVVIDSRRKSYENYLKDRDIRSYLLARIPPSSDDGYSANFEDCRGLD